MVLSEQEGTPGRQQQREAFPLPQTTVWRRTCTAGVADHTEHGQRATSGRTDTWKPSTHWRFPQGSAKEEACGSLSRVAEVS
jgi:hypothetical protein